MMPIQILIDESLLKLVDQAASEMQTNRSVFIQNVLELSIRQLQIRKLEEQHAAGYARIPSTVDEFAEWNDEQMWDFL